MHSKLFSKCTVPINPSWPGLPELRQGLGGGIFFKVFQCLHYIKIISVKVGLAKEKFLKKKVMAEKPWGGADLPPQAN